MSEPAKGGVCPLILHPTLQRRLWNELSNRAARVRARGARAGPSGFRVNNNKIHVAVVGHHLMPV